MTEYDLARINASMILSFSILLLVVVILLLIAKIDTKRKQKK